MWKDARVALLDPNIKTLPGARAALGASFAASAADGDDVALAVEHLVDGA